MINTAEYTEKLEQFVQGNLPAEAWIEYCQKLLSEILEVRVEMVR
jgi:hypothetical protein